MGKETVILIPGLLCDASLWQHQIQALDTRANVIIPDLTEASTPREMVAAVLLDAPQTFVLAGHSMGGWVALEIMRTCADRVMRLCLMNTTAALDSPEKAHARHTMIAMAERGEFDVLIDRLLDAFLFQQHCREAVRTMLFRNRGAFIHQEHAMQQRAECLTLLKQIQCPTLIIHSTHDAIFNAEDCRLLQDNITGSRVVTLEQCGHLSPMEVPDEVTTHLMEWFELCGDEI